MKSIKCLSGSSLKMIAVISMIIDHTAVVFIENYIAQGELLWGPASYEELQFWYQVNGIMRTVGRLAFPIFCYLIAEGFAHTRDSVKYAGRLLIFAVVSEIPFDMAMFRTWFYPGYQNVYVTLLLGLLAVMGIDRFRREGSLWKQALTAGLCCGAAWLLKCDYDAFGVFLIILFYLLHGDLPRQVVFGSICLMWEPAAVLAFIPICLYNGTRGKGNRKWFFYTCYPVHLAALALIRTGYGLFFLN